MHASAETGHATSSTQFRFEGFNSGVPQDSASSRSAFALTGAWVGDGDTAELRGLEPKGTIMPKNALTQSDHDVEVVLLTLASETDHKVAEASVRVGDFKINQITVWRASNGAIRVYLPALRVRWDGGRLAASRELPALLS